MRIKLHKTQLEVAKDTSRFRVICAGRRWGKSVVSRMVVLQWASQNPGLYYIVSPTYKQAKSIHWNDLKSEIPKKWINKKNEVDLSVTLANGSIIELKGAENPDALRGVKLRGLVIDEIAMIRNWDWLWEEVLQPTLVDFKAPAIFISTPKGYNHFYTIYKKGLLGNDEYDPAFKSWKFTSYDNPTIPSEEIDRQKETMNEDKFAQEYLAEFKTFEGLVYTQFDRDLTVIPEFEVPKDWDIYRGMDFGSNNPTVCVWIARDNDGNLFLIDEYYKQGETIDYHAGMIKSNRYSSNVRSTYGDPSGTQWIMEFNTRGVYITPAVKEMGQPGKMWVTFGIEKMQELLKPKVGHYVMTPHIQPRTEGLPNFYVTSNCTHAIDEFESYRWKERNTASAQDLNAPEVPEKANDHVMDAIRYVVVSYKSRKSRRNLEEFPDDTKFFKGGFY